MNDAFRALVAGLLSTVPAVAVIVVVFPPGADDVRSRALGLGGGMIYLAFYQLIYQLITWLVFRRPDAASLRDWAIASRPRTRTQRQVQFWLGSGAINWGVSAAMLALLAVVALASRGFSGAPVLLAIAVVTVVVSTRRGRGEARLLRGSAGHRAGRSADRRQDRQDPCRDRSRLTDLGGRTADG
ncbi:hypothetical protein SAMN04489812_5485 [Microlunatus soli]|uniref:Uncharacterized protein n=2 Tax=Microlunatus soli TaxID=630515 RepID=A0A1H1ZVB3_9ACTN|nr:hypothetical protein SAMN04489812_5485 [Microlunatus soli]